MPGSRSVLIGFVTVSMALLMVASGKAQTVRILKFSEGQPFRMGKVTSQRIVQPDMGARRLTLNYSASEAGAEFAQHVHDNSDDTILLLKGEALLRQGDSRTPFHTGQCVFVPAGQIHGTITTANGTVMISFQVPPDLALYTGARDSSRPGAVAPKGVITPGAVKYLDFENQNGFFVGPKMGAQRLAVAYRKLRPKEPLATETASGTEEFFFVWKGAIAVNSGGKAYSAGERDTVFISGPEKLRITASEPAIVIQVQSPPAIR